MIDTSMTVKALIDKGFAVAVFIPTTLQTDEPAPQYIGGLDVTIFHKDMKQPRHDSKPWKMATGKDSILQAQSESEQTLSNAAASTSLNAIMKEHTTV